jgi:hypothetical protein
MNWCRYPDPGGLDSDRERLNFAVHFATAQRARTLRRIYEAARDDASPDELLFMAVDALEEKMTAIEDTIGWIAALRAWLPSTGRTLFPLLDRVEVHRDLEGSIAAYLEALDEEGLRELLRIRAADLAASGLPPTIRKSIDGSVAALLPGLRRVLDFRRARDRYRVVMFNKSKHMLQGAVLRGRDGTHALRYIRASDSACERVGDVVATSQHVRTVAAEGIVIQAVLHGMLAAILMAHYPEPYISPEWVTRA